MIFLSGGNRITSYLSQYHTKPILKIRLRLNYLVYNQGDLLFLNSGTIGFIALKYTPGV